eukprot:3505663-Rhodomonas_salina.2
MTEGNGDKFPIMARINITLLAGCFSVCRTSPRQEVCLLQQVDAHVSEVVDLTIPPIGSPFSEVFAHVVCADGRDGLRVGDRVPLHVREVALDSPLRTRS